MLGTDITVSACNNPAGETGQSNIGGSGAERHVCRAVLHRWYKKGMVDIHILVTH